MQASAFSFFNLAEGQKSLEWMITIRPSRHTQIGYPRDKHTNTTLGRHPKDEEAEYDPMSPQINDFSRPPGPKTHLLGLTRGNRLYLFGGVRASCTCMCVCVSCGLTIWVIWLSLVWCTVMIHLSDSWSSIRLKRKADTYTGCVHRI